MHWPGQDRDRRSHGVELSGGRSRTGALVVLLGLVSILMLWVTTRISERPVVEEFPVYHAVADLGLVLATSHLWLEEYLTGDKGVDLDSEVWGNLDHAVQLTQALLEGGYTGDGKAIEIPLRSAGSRGRVIRIQELLAEFRLRAMTRVSRREGAGVGSSLDEGYDRVFRLLLSEVLILEDSIEEKMEAHRHRARLLSAGILLAWVGALVLAVLGLARRDRQRRAAVEALRHSEEHLDATLRSIGDAVFATDTFGKVTFVNEVAEQLTGWPQETMLGRSLDEVLRLYCEETGAPRDSAHEQALLRGMAASRRDLLLERRDGSRVAVDETAAPIRSRGGRTTGIVLICRDVNERKAAEAALREVEAQLRQAQKLEAVGRLAGGVAHDINNYLGAIVNQGALIKILRADDQEIVDNVDILLGTVDRTASLIKRLLAFGRKQPVRREVVSLNRIVEELSSLMERLVDDGVDLVICLEEEPWNLEIDPAQLEQVLVNLLVNAQEAMPHGGKIFVETRNVALTAREASEVGVKTAGDFAVLTVRDTGVGIETPVREKIFEPFFTTKGDRGSSGLGLSTVYGIVRQFEGVIQVESEAGAGSEFRIYFPRTDRDPTWISPIRKSLSEMESLHILLVEDHEDFRRSIRDMLEALGHRVETASDGETALDLYRLSTGSGDVFDLVITDVLMPGLSGKEVAERLLRDEPGLTLILMTGFTDHVVVEDLLRRSNVDLLDKPFTAAELTDVMARLLQNRKSDAQRVV